MADCEGLFKMKVMLIKKYLTGCVACLMGLPLLGQVNGLNQEKVKAYEGYVKKLDCYQKTFAFSDTIGKAFMAGDIATVRQLSAERDGVLMEVIDSVLAFEPNGTSSLEASYFVNNLAFNLSWQNAEKAAGRFDKALVSSYLDELRGSVEKEKRVQPGCKASDFELFDKDGQRYTLASFAGKYVFLEFSASWCSWCKKEIPSIKKAYERFGNEVVFITVFLDDVREKWLGDIDRHPVPWLCLSDLKAWKSPIAPAYNISGVPNCFVIGPDGVIKAKGLRGKEVEDTLEGLLNPGIQFETGSFAEALKKSGETGKPIFMDCYTSWCAPCKMMNTTVFTEAKVGAFFNRNFVNVKFDMEKGEGRDLMKRYGMQVFPTYLLLDAEGNEVHRVVGGHDADEFIRLMSEGMDAKNSIAGLGKRFEAGDRDKDFLRHYIEVLGGGYRFDMIPAVLDELCRQNGKDISESDWQLMRRYLSNPSSYAFRYAAANRKALQQYVKPEDLEAWIQKVVFVPVFNAVNEAVFDSTKYDAARFTALRKDIRTVKPERASYLVAMLDYYDAFAAGKMGQVLRIYKKHFMNLPSQDRFGVTMQLNAMLYAKGNAAECEEGLKIFREVLNPADPIFKNFEKSLQEKITLNS